MGESLLLITIVTLVILTIRRSKQVVLDNPLIISRPGKYHITFAPQLNPAQTFIEEIAKKVGDIAPGIADSEVECFAVYDPKVYASKEKLYLMAGALRSGVLFFQAINPLPLLSDSESHYKTMSKFAEAVLAEHPRSGAADEQSGRLLRDAVVAAAQEMQIRVEALVA